jgi:hypothetical protein
MSRNVAKISINSSAKNYNNDHAKIDNTDRKNIQIYLNEFKIPKKPADEPNLSKEFVSSCLSSNQPPFRMRNKLKSLIGEIPTRKTISLCLSKLFTESRFINDSNWTFINLHKMSTEMKQAESVEYGGMKSAILDILQNGSKIMGEQVAGGLEIFYENLQYEIDKGPENVWKFMEIFTNTIPGVGPGLFSDFLKNIGFVDFVKIDYHFKREFPELIRSEYLAPKLMFVHTINLCNKLGMTAFHFDHVLYQWGRYKALLSKKNNVTNASTCNADLKMVSKNTGRNEKEFHQNTARTKNVEKSEENFDGEKRFDGLIRSNKKWREECFKLTIHRQNQLGRIFAQYGGNMIPFSHFTSEMTTNMKLRNEFVYPAVCAYICGVLKKFDGGLIHPKGLKWGVKVIKRNGNLWDNSSQIF